MWDRADGDVNEGHNTWVEDVLVIRRANRSDNLGEREAQEGRTIEFFPVSNSTTSTFALLGISEPAFFT
jgi:hypothetical protein